MKVEIHCGLTQAKQVAVLIIHNQFVGQGKEILVRDVSARLRIIQRKHRLKDALSKGCVVLVTYATRNKFKGRYIQGSIIIASVPQSTFSPSDSLGKQ
jgi:hypothetical protein